MSAPSKMYSISDFLNIYSLIGCVLVLIWYKKRSSHHFWHKSNIKCLKPVSFLKTVYDFMFPKNAFHERLDYFYKALHDEPFGGIYEMQKPQLLVKDPQLVSTILVKDFKHFHDLGFKQMRLNDKKADPLNVHLTFSDGERWKALRQKISPAFAPGKLKQMHNQISDCVALLTKYVDKQMDESDSVDIGLKELFEKLTTDVIGSCAFGIDCNSLKSNQKFSEMGKQVFKFRIVFIVRVILATFCPLLAKFINVSSLKKEVNDFYLNLALDTMQHRRQNGVIRNDLLQLLMDLQNTHIDPKYAVGDKNQKLLQNGNYIFSFIMLIL